MRSPASPRQSLGKNFSHGRLLTVTSEATAISARLAGGATSERAGQRFSAWRCLAARAVRPHRRPVAAGRCHVGERPSQAAFALVRFDAFLTLADAAGFAAVAPVTSPASWARPAALVLLRRLEGDVPIGRAALVSICGSRWRAALSDSNTIATRRKELWSSPRRRSAVEGDIPIKPCEARTQGSADQSGDGDIDGQPIEVVALFLRARCFRRCSCSLRPARCEARWSQCSLVDARAYRTTTRLKLGLVVRC